MSEIGVIITFVVVLFGGVIAYSFFSTSLGFEEDENKNYIPDRLERIFGKNIEKKDKKKSKND
ncbi:MAG: hypothetical protein CMC67_00595 [Flavobacteriaceae bacterium]|jgi:hypothetical protein|nr:hypothetical protein [Flavobacteriaceae bacterium]|tara:strand:- start:866 stop:1054 length:189 start_codon:yes stop_codon:yes gene_type:complete